MIGTLVVTKQNGKYLFAHFTGGEYKKETALTFYEVDEADLGVPLPGTIFPTVTKIDVWNADELQNQQGTLIGESEWRQEGWEGAYRKKLDWQIMNFLYDMQGDLYLLFTDKSATYVDPIVYPKEDYAKLFKIERSGNKFTVKYIAKKHLFLDVPVNIGSLDAVGGVYVSPTGRLILYTAAHDNDWPPFIFDTPPDNLGVCNGSDLYKSLEMGEFASNSFYE